MYKADTNLARLRRWQNLGLPHLSSLAGMECLCYKLVTRQYDSITEAEVMFQLIQSARGSSLTLSRLEF